MKALEIIQTLGIHHNRALNAMCDEYADLYDMCNDARHSIQRALDFSGVPLDPTHGYHGPEDIARHSARYTEKLSRYEWATMVLHTMVAAELNVTLEKAAEMMANASKGIK